MCHPVDNFCHKCRVPIVVCLWVPWWRGRRPWRSRRRWPSALGSPSRWANPRLPATATFWRRWWLLQRPQVFNGMKSCLLKLGEISFRDKTTFTNAHNWGIFRTFTSFWNFSIFCYVFSIEQRDVLTFRSCLLIRFGFYLSKIYSDSDTEIKM